jgi:NAD(P)-dependent dehydrogenase (short-subunit alcohol dehydrogenase family)
VPVDAPRRTALVTGAARGIGRATAGALAVAGWDVVAGVRDPAALVPFAAPGVRVVRLDVTDPESVRAGVGEAEALTGGPLGLVVNNAGWALFGAVEDVDPDLARRVFDTNVFGALAVLQAALPGMRRAGGGVVVSVSTLSGRVPLPLFGLYSASKLALAAITEALALELAPVGVRAVVIEAGVVRTEFALATVVSGAAGGPDPLYGPIRDRVLGSLRAIRDQAGLEASDVAAAVVRAAEDPATPARLVLADAGLAAVADAVGGPAADALDQVRAHLGLPVAGEPDPPAR